MLQAVFRRHRLARGVLTSLILAAALPNAVVHAAERVLFDDSFTDLNRFDQSLPGSAAWRYVGEGVGQERMNLAPPLLQRAMQLNSTGSAFLMNTYFTSSGSPRTLEVGDSLEMTMQVTLSAAPDAATGLRIGLYDSKGSRPAADIAASGVVDPSTYGVYSGYGIYFNPIGNTSNLSAFNIVRKTTADNFGVPQVSNGPILNAGSNLLPALGIGPNIPFAVNIRIRRLTATSVEVRTAVNGVVATVTDSNAAFTTAFDTVSFFGSGASVPNGQTLRIDDVVVQYTPGGGAAQTLLNDAFSDGLRTNQSLPETSSWFLRVQNVNATPATMLSVPTTSTPNLNRDLVYRAGNLPASGLAYFTDSAPVSLAEGEAIVLRASVRTTVPVNVARGLRVALLNSNGSRIGADVDTTQTAPAGPFSGYRGYSIDLNTTNSAAGSLVAAKRTSGSDELFDSAAWTALTPASEGSSGVTPSIWTRVSLRLVRIGATLRLEALVDETWVIANDSTPDTFAFDTIAINFGPGIAPSGTVRVDDVLVVHSTGLVANVSSPRTIVSENFNSGGWNAATFIGSSATGSVSRQDVGSYDGLGSLIRSGGMRLTADSSGASGPWSATLSSGPLTGSNSVTDLALLTLAFDARTSSTRPFRIALESLDSAGASTGRLERWVYPRAADYLQRYSFELSTMTVVSGTFNPTAGAYQLLFSVEGGTSSPSAWSAGVLTVEIDNVHFASPRYFVSPTGSNANPGTIDAPFATIARANALVVPGDIVLIRSGTGGFPDYQVSTDSNNQGIQITRGGAAGAWVTYKNYPGERPTIRNVGWNVVRIGAGFASTRDRTTDVGYVELRGFELHGISDTLAEEIKGSASNGSANTGGVTIEGRFMANRPHHIRIVDMTARNLSGGGLTGIQTDYVALEGNLVRDTSFWTAYATSGISFLQPFDYSGLPNEWRLAVADNELIRNQSLRIWVQINAISDGNGVILDNFYNSQGNSTEGAYSGRTLVQSNLMTQNGGSGSHAFTSRRVTFINNTAYHNSQVLNYGELWSNQSDDILFVNNILVSPPTVSGSPKPLNPVITNASSPIVQGVQFLNNIYQVGAGSQAPVVRPGDANNVLTSAPIFVDAPGGDFRIRPGSPAINHGQLTATTSFQDILGYPRATDGVIDAGAYERQPMILRSPSSVTANSGQTVVLSVAAVGDNLTYTWFKNDVEIAGQNGATLTLTNVSSVDAGSYRVLVATPFDSLSSTSAVVTILTVIDQWRLAVFGTAENSGVAADGADADGDGLVNLLEYALGLNPLSIDSAGRLTHDVTTIGSDKYLTLTFTVNTAAPGVALKVQASGDLATWSDLVVPGANVVSESVNGSSKTYVVRDSVPVGTGANRRYLRLAVGKAAGL